MEKKTRNYRPIFIITALILLVVGAVCFCCSLYLSDKFLSGTRIAGIDVSGMDVQQAAIRVNQGLERAARVQIVFSQGEYVFKTTLANISEPVDTNNAVKQVWAKEKQRNPGSMLKSMMGQEKNEYSLNIEYNVETIQKLQQEWQECFGGEPINAELDVDKQQGLVIIPEVTGKKVDMEATMVMLPQHWEDVKPVSAVIEIVEEIPQVTAKDLKVMGELSSYYTWYRVAEVDRTHNLNKAAEAVNGTMVAPNGVFSFNKIVGVRTPDTGFRQAPVIVGNKFEPGVGGGICQVSSTLYNACLLAGLEIVERHNHALAVSYVPLGLDATVAYGTSDYKFRNDTGYPLYIRAIARGGKLTVNVYGHKDYKQKITTNHIVDEVIPFEYVEEIDPELKYGETRVEHAGFPGYTVRSFRTYYDEAGKVVKTELLARDKYRPFPELTYVSGEEPLIPESVITPDGGPDGYENLGKEDESSAIDQNGQENLESVNDDSPELEQPLESPEINIDNSSKNNNSDSNPVEGEDDSFENEI